MSFNVILNIVYFHVYRFGHLKGKERLEQTIRWVLVDLGIPYLTVYALSADNLSKRTPEVQLHFLMS